MFSGIIAAQGRLCSREVNGDHIRMDFALPHDWQLELGSSVAVNGVCLTTVASSPGHASFDLCPETVRRSSLAALAEGGLVNLERPVRVGDGLHGHIVQGHVDGVGRILAVAPAAGGGMEIDIEVPAALRRYVVDKGSVTLDGISLTVAATTPAGITVAIVPHTAQATTLGWKREGDSINIEVDILAKYVEKLMHEGRDGNLVDASR